MNKKNIYLFAGILSFLVFIGYLGEAGPYSILGYSVNIWFIRLAWLMISISNLSSYMKIRKAENEAG